MWRMDRKQVVLGVVLLFAVIFGIGYKLALMREKASFRPLITAASENAGDAHTGDTGPMEVDKAGSDNRSENKINRTVTVYITGAVKTPGVYTFPEGARINDGVNWAGSAGNADLSGINLAEIMRDQQQVYVPKKGETTISRNSAGSGRVSGGGVTGGGSGGKININIATAENLDSLPGIGPSFARRIIDYRNEHGSFRSVSELLKVSGIGEKKYSQIKDRVTI